MKYPQNQFEILVKSLRVLKQYIDIETLNLHPLHFLVYQQFSEGQKHNWLILNNEKLERNSIIEGNVIKGYKTDNGAKKIIDTVYNFELYRVVKPVQTYTFCEKKYRFERDPYQVSLSDT